MKRLPTPTELKKQVYLPLNHQFSPTSRQTPDNLKQNKNIFENSEKTLTHYLGHERSTEKKLGKIRM